jgi:hypothetical protein
LWALCQETANFLAIVVFEMKIHNQNFITGKW